jgi:hypothetical protein
MRDETLTIESVGTTSNSAGGGSFAYNSVLIDRATSYSITTDITTPCETLIELGDNGTWSALKEAISIGRRFKIGLNGSPLMTGRLLTRAMPLNAQAGATVQIVVRTNLADAAYSSCGPVNIQGATLKDIVLQAYKTIGLVESDFEFDADVARDLITGRGKNTNALVDLSAITEQNARVQPPETVYAFADRHLRRFGLMHWDSPNGKVAVGKPNDKQQPIYWLQSSRQNPRGNNILDCRRSEDYESVPTSLAVYGQGGGRDYARSTISHTLSNSVLTGVSPPILRPTMVIDESVGSLALAEYRAKRELAQRSLNMDSWDVTVRNWTYSDQNQQLVPWTINTVCGLVVDVASPVQAPFFIWRVARTGNASEGHSTRLTLAAQGVWDI